jgi:hypothetical protein
VSDSRRAKRDNQDARALLSLPRQLGAFFFTAMYFMVKRERLATHMRWRVITVRNKLDLVFSYTRVESPTQMTFDPNTLLLRAGDVEQNPGPGEGVSGMDQIGMESAHVLQTLSQSVQALSAVVQRLEEGQKQLCNSVNQQFGGLQKALDKQLGQLSDEQEVLRLDLDELNSRQEQVEDDITSLKNTVQQLTDALEAEKRKLNLSLLGYKQEIGQHM